MRKSLDSIYIILLGIYVSLVVGSNLIFQKFLSISFTEGYDLSISAGLLVFPATFLITDIISELYGKKAANMIVVSAFIGFIFVIFTIKLANYLPAQSWSPIDDFDFERMFCYTDIAYFASLVSSLIAQFIDIHIFHVIAEKTKGKHLWLRNNVSTFISQFFDSFVVIAILVYFEVITDDVALPLFASSYLYKFLFAIADTPFVYLFTLLFKKEETKLRFYGK